jgi:hypothetical protein
MKGLGGGEEDGVIVINSFFLGTFRFFFLSILPLVEEFP